MKQVLLVSALVLFVASTSAAAAANPTSDQTAARHKSGPVTVRGVAAQVGTKRFMLQTATKGEFAVDISPPTTVVEKGHSGRVTVTDGAHVGVRGYVHGRTMRAIQVRVYPIAPKQVSIRGTIAGISRNRLRIRSGAVTRSAMVTGGTVILTSSAPLTLSALRVGDRVEARLRLSGHDMVAIHIHVYRAQAPQKHVRVNGTVLTTGAHDVVVRQAGAALTIGIDSQTRFLTGTSSATGSLRAGESVTVYACCAGHPLIATSIHIHVSKTVVRTAELRGTVVSLDATSLRLNTPHVPVIHLQSSTVFEVGSIRTTRTGVRLGDVVSVRGNVAGPAFTATRVHVFASSRVVSTVRGNVTGVTATSLRVVERGATYTVTLGRGTTAHLAGRSIRASQIRTGDRARAVGHLSGHQLQATSVDVTRITAKMVTVRGTLIGHGTAWLLVTRSSGGADTVRLDSHTRVTFQGHQVTVGYLFAGMHVVAAGTRSGSDLNAVAVSVTAKRRTETGRLVKLAGFGMQLKRTSGTVIQVDLPVGVLPRDGSRVVALHQLGRGAYVRVNGYVELSKALRAIAITVLHPALTLAGVLTWRGSAASVVTASGEIYTTIFGPGSVVAANHLNITLHPSEIPSGTAVHVVGIVDAGGSLTVRTMTAQLHSATLRARVGTLEGGGLTLSTGGVSIRVRLNSGTLIAQGSHTLLVQDIVAGDDVTVYGYALQGGVVLARKLAVHRRILGTDGIVASVTDGTFVLAASDGPHTVLTSSTTLIFGVAGTTLAKGMKVHVTGYLRGDGSILATRVRILKAPS